MFSLEIFEIKFYFTHVLFNVSAGHDCFGGGDCFRIVIDSDQHDRDLRFQCDVVESFFQLGLRLRVPSSDCKMKLRSFGKDLCHLFYQ